jgi:hypothetical protein
MIGKIWKKCDKIWKVWKKNNPYLITIRLAFLPYFPYHFTIFFHIVPIFSPFSSVFSISFHYSTDFSSIFSKLISDKIGKIRKKSKLNSEKDMEIMEETQVE